MAQRPQSPVLVHAPLKVPEEVAVEEHEPPTLTDEDSIDRAHSHSSHEHSDRTQDEEAARAKPTLQRTITSSSRPVPVVKIPRSQRTGPLGRLTVLYEAEESTLR